MVLSEIKTLGQQNQDKIIQVMTGIMQNAIQNGDLATKQLGQKYLGFLQSAPSAGEAMKDILVDLFEGTPEALSPELQKQVVEGFNTPTILVKTQMDTIADQLYSNKPNLKSQLKTITNKFQIIKTNQKLLKNKNVEPFIVNPVTLFNTIQNKQLISKN